MYGSKSEVWVVSRIREVERGVDDRDGEAAVVEYSGQLDQRVEVSWKW